MLTGVEVFVLNKQKNPIRQLTNRVLYFTLKNNTLCYFTLSTIALNAAG